MTFLPAFSPAGDFRRVDALGVTDLRIPAAATHGVLSVWETIAGPNEGPPMHIHSREDEMFYVLAGQFRFWCGDESFDGGPGTTAVLPRNVPHSFRNVGTTAGRLLVTVTPGGFEGFFLEVERRKATTPGEIAVIAARYGLSFVPPKAEAA